MWCVSDCKKIESVQERALCYVFNDFNNTYSNLLNTASKSTLYLARLYILAIEIFKTLNDISPLYMKDVFIQKEVIYGLRDVNLLVQLNFKTVSYSHNTIKYQGSKLWNNVPIYWNKLVPLSQCISKECKYYFIKRMKIYDAKLIVYMSSCQLQTLPTLTHPTSTLAALIQTICLMQGGKWLGLGNQHTEKTIDLCTLLRIGSIGSDIANQCISDYRNRFEVWSCHTVTKI